MSHPSKVKGTRWESAVRDWFNSLGFDVVRPALHGSVDKGDLFGVPGWTIQCKDTARLDLAGAVDDAIEQARNARTAFAVAIVKRRRRGVGDAYAVMTLAQWATLLSSPAVREFMREVARPDATRTA